MATTQLVQPTSATTGDLPYIGAQANDNQGTPLRDSFLRLNNAITAIYGTQNSGGTPQTPFVDGDNIKNDTIDEGHLSVTNSPTDGYVLTYDSATQGFTWEQKFDGEIGDIVAGNGLSGVTQADGNESLELDLNDLTEEVIDTANDLFAFVDSSDSNNTKKESIADLVAGIASGGLTSTSGVLNVGAGTGITVNANDVQISDNGVDYQQLAERYTEKETIITTPSTYDLDASSFAVFEFSGNLGTIDMNIESMKIGQVIDIVLSGTDLSSAVITLSADEFTANGATFNKVGSTSLDTTKKNIIQVLCLKDDDTSSKAVFNYAIGTYEEDDTP